MKKHKLDRTEWSIIINAVSRIFFFQIIYFLNNSIYLHVIYSYLLYNY